MRGEFPDTLCIEQGVVLSFRFAERKVRRAPRVLRMAVVSQSSVKFGKKLVLLVGATNFMINSFLMPLSAVNWKTSMCTIFSAFSDVNECSSGAHRCDGNATCTNSVGSYKCECNIAYQGNGTHCTCKSAESQEPSIFQFFCFSRIYWHAESTHLPPL